jgi:hypothetical protein
MAIEAVQPLDESAELAANTDKVLLIAFSLLKEGKHEEAAELLVSLVRNSLPDGHPSKGFSGVIQGDAASQLSKFESDKTLLQDSAKLWAVMLPLHNPEGHARLHSSIINFFTKARPDLMPAFTTYLTEVEAEHAAATATKKIEAEGN